MDTNDIQTASKAIPILKSLLGKFKDSDRRFANDLIDSHRRKGLSERQAPWVGKMIARASSNGSVTSTTIGDVTALKALFDRAAVHLRSPSVVFQVPEIGVVRVVVTKRNTKHHGRTLVADYGKLWPEAKDYGFITDQGQFEPCEFVHIPKTLIQGLQDFAANPIKYAKEYGRLTGRCCFCRKRLTDERSTGQGYGPDCAEHFLLPWGERPEADTVFLASDQNHTPVPVDDNLFAGLEPLKG